MELIFEISSPAALSEFVKMLLKTLLKVFRYYSQKIEIKRKNTTGNFKKTQKLKLI